MYQFRRLRLAAAVLGNEIRRGAKVAFCNHPGSRVESNVTLIAVDSDLGPDATRLLVEWCEIQGIDRKEIVKVE